MNCLPTQFPERAKPSAGTGTQKSIQLSPVLKKPPLHGRDGSSMSYGVGVEGRCGGADNLWRRVAFCVAGVVGELLQGDHTLPRGPRSISHFPGLTQGSPRAAPSLCTRSPKRHGRTWFLSLSRSPFPSTPPSLPLFLTSPLPLLLSHGCFIFRVQGSSPKPMTFTLWNETLFSFPFPMRLLCELYPGSLPLLLVLK